MEPQSQQPENRNNDPPAPVAGSRKSAAAGTRKSGGPLMGGTPPPPPAQADPDSPTLRAQFARTWRHGRQMLFRDQPKLTALYMLMFLLSSFAMMVIPQLFGEITNALQQSAARSGESLSLSRQNLLWLFLGWAALLLIARPLVNILVKIVSVRLDNRMGLALGQRLFRTVLNQPLPFFHQRDIGGLTYLLRDMCTQAQRAIRQLTLDPILMVASLLTGLGFVIYNYLKISGDNTSFGSWLVVAALLILGLASPLLVSRFAPGLQLAASELRDRQAALAALLQGSLQSPEEVQSFNAVEHFGDKHRDALGGVHHSVEQQTWSVEKVNFFNTIPSDLTQVLLVGAAMLLVFASNSVEHIGSLVAILLLVPQLMRPIQGLSSVIVSLKSSWPSIDGVLDIIDGAAPSDADANRQKAVATKADERDTDRSAPAISARDLHFRYAPGLPPVFDGASFSIPRGKISTVVARMGQGKTTLFRLLLRFYQPESGGLNIGGLPLDEIDPRQLRHDIALLSQFPAFTHDSVRENLRLAAPEADDARLLDLCRQTGLLEMLATKLATENEKAVLDAPFASGSMLSGGQRRLFALTRCLLRDPAILLLDEPTTGLDNREKADLIPVLQKLCAGKTVVIVDHDTRWIHRVCDHFVVLEAGRTEVFTDRESVLRESELFAELHGGKVLSVKV